jgi:hypothetical protein
MGVPAAGLKVNFHVAVEGLFIPDPEDGAAKVRATFQAGEPGMKNAYRFSIRRFEQIAFKALMLPYGMQQLFGRRRIVIAEDRNSKRPFAPGSVKIFSARKHTPIFLCERGQSQAVLKDKYRRREGLD